MDLSMYHVVSTTTTDSDVHGDAAILFPSHLSSSSFFYSPPIVNQQVQCSAGTLLPPTHHPADLAASPLRRVFSTGDLKVHASEQSISTPAGGTGTVVGRYSAEERRERIDKYRTKRNHRNFHKKITYACRKTLADSRPRVKGRFARNGGEPDHPDYPDTNGDITTNIISIAGYEQQIHDHYDSHGISGGTAGGGGGGGSTSVVNDGDEAAGVAKVPDWWPAMQEALEREKAEEDEEVLSGILHCNDQELLAAYLGVSSINLYSPTS